MDGNNFKGNYYNSKIAPDDAVCFQRYSFGGRGNPTPQSGLFEFSSFALMRIGQIRRISRKNLFPQIAAGLLHALTAKMPFIQSAIVYCNVSGNIDLRDAWKLFHDRQLAGNYTKISKMLIP